MKQDLSNNSYHLEWLAKATAEAKKRFLRLEPADASHTHWRLMNSFSEQVFPHNAWGATRASINGFFMHNPQA